MTTSHIEIEVILIVKLSKFRQVILCKSEAPSKVDSLFLGDFQKNEDFSFSENNLKIK